MTKDELSNRAKSRSKSLTIKIAKIRDLPSERPRAENHERKNRNHPKNRDFSPEKNHRKKRNYSPEKLRSSPRKSMHSTIHKVQPQVEEYDPEKLLKHQIQNQIHVPSVQKKVENTVKKLIMKAINES